MQQKHTNTQRFEKQAQDAVARAQALLNDHPELNVVMLELNEAYGLLEMALNPDNNTDPRLPFDGFIPQLESDEFGSEDFGPRDTIQEALAILERIQARASAMDDEVERQYMIRCI